MAASYRGRAALDHKGEGDGEVGISAVGLGAEATSLVFGKVGWPPLDHNLTRMTASPPSLQLAMSPGSHQSLDRGKSHLSTRITSERTWSLPSNFTGRSAPCFGPIKRSAL